MVDFFKLFNINEIESKLLSRALVLNPDGNHKTWGDSLHEGNLTWVGLSPQTLITPYDELLRMLKMVNPKPDELIMDLGAGYGQLALIIHEYYPETNFRGFEFVPERVDEAQRVYQVFNLKRASIHQQDLTDETFDLNYANYYFIYDYGKIPHMRKTMKQIEKNLEDGPICVIARGYGIRSLIDYEFKWLTAIYREENFSIYSS